MREYEMTKVKIDKKHKEKQSEPEQSSEALESEAQGSQEPGQAERELSELKQKLEELERQNLYLRADFANYRRNMEQERSRFLEEGKELALKDFFVLFEHLERAIGSAREHQIQRAVLDGLELVMRDFQKILEKYGIERIKTIGERFDPKIHEAISVVDAEDREPGTIVYEHQPGFIREGRVLQPARVVVAKEKV
jgi:molecular chaperone GrpE